MNKTLAFSMIGLGWGLAAALAVLLWNEINLRIADRLNLAARAPLVQATPWSENVASSDYDMFAQKTWIYSVGKTPPPPDASVVMFVGKFDLHEDGALVLPAGVTVEQAADAFVTFAPRTVSAQGVAANFSNFCVASFDNGLGWRACLKSDGHVVYTGKPLPSQTVEFLDLAAKKLAAK